MGKRKYNLNDYLITMDGKVISKISGKERKLVDSGKGYLQVEIADKKYLVHRLVAKMYLPNPDNLPEVNHKDGNKGNNCVDNLEWCSHKINMEHAKNNGLIKNGEKNKSKLKESDIYFIREHTEFNTVQLSRLYQVSPSTISQIRLKKIWKDI